MDIRVINTEKLSRGSLHVRIIKVDSPTLLWVQLYHAREDLEELLDDLKHRMTRKGRGLIHNPDHVLPDEYVAVQEGKTWQRGIILSLEGRDMVTVALRDWGRIIQRPVNDMYILEDRFREMNWQAIPCGLAHLRPVGRGRQRWSRNSRTLTKALLRRREGWMRILDTVETYGAVISLELRRESEEEMNNLEGLLVAMGCAYHASETIVATIPSILQKPLEGIPLETAV